MAIKEEDFERAGQLSKEVSALTDSLPPKQQFLLHHQERLLDPAAPLQERVSAMNALGQFGDAGVLPQLAACLQEAATELQEAAQDACWAVFMRSGSLEIDQLMEEGVALMQGAGPAGAGSRTGLTRALEVFDEMVRLAPSYAEVGARMCSSCSSRLRMRHSVGCLDPRHMLAAPVAWCAARAQRPWRQTANLHRGPTASGLQGHNKRATVLYLMRRYHESIQATETTLELNPYHFGAASGLGLCHMGLDQPLQALHAFERALSIHPGMAQVRRYVNALRLSLTTEQEQQQQQQEQEQQQGNSDGGNAGEAG